MTEDLIRYDIIAQDALRSVVRTVLRGVAKDGMPGDHHFYISFATQAPGVRLSSRLHEKYPETMTIVLQHQYWDLEITEHAFSVGLSFDGIPEKLLIPFSAIQRFLDPSVEFGLEFSMADETSPFLSGEMGDHDAEEMAADGAADTASDAKAADGETAAAPANESDDDSSSGAEVVSLDAFRKKT
ncbi:MAG: ClpXP protease specificity-enhancing factor SspB [Pseudomonadota bacterium]